MPPSRTVRLQTGEHVLVLDGLRGLAILSVLLFHFGQFGHGLPPATVLLDRVFNKLFQVGWVGVDLFFVLSGFLITGILYDSKKGDHYFRNFYARRCLRIFPLYYATLIFFLICLPRLFPSHEGVQDLTRDAFWYWTYLSNVLLGREGWQLFGFLDHFWSLAVEEQFYLVWPLVVLICTRRRLVQICVAMIVMALVVRTGLWLTGYDVAAYVLSPARMDALAVGAVLALIARGPNGFAGVVSAVRPLAILTGSTLALIFLSRHGLDQRDVIVGTIGQTLLAFFFGSLLVIGVTSAPQDSLGRWLSSPVFTFFGKYSYALYVVHNPLLYARPSWLSLQAVPTIFGSQLPARFLYLAIAILICVGLALLSWHLSEKQFLKLKRFFPYQSGHEGARALVSRGELSSATPS